MHLASGINVLGFIDREHVCASRPEGKLVEQPNSSLRLKALLYLFLLYVPAEPVDKVPATFRAQCVCGPGGRRGYAPHV